MANNARRGLFGLIVFQPFIVPVLVAKGQGTGGQADGERGMNRQQRFPRQAVALVAAAPRTTPGVERNAGRSLARAAYSVAQNVAATWCVR